MPRPTPRLAPVTSAQAPLRVGLAGIGSDKLAPYRSGVTLSVAGRDHELIAVGIAECRERAPRLLLWLGDELHTSLCQFAKSGPHVVARKDHIRRRSDAVLLTRWGVEHYAGLRSGDAQLDPALLAEWLICRPAEPQLARVEVECGVLVDPLCHRCSSARSGRARSAPQRLSDLPLPVPADGR